MYSEGIPIERKQMEFNETLEDVAEYTGTLDVDFS